MKISRSIVERTHIQVDYGWVDFYLEDIKPRVSRLIIVSDWGTWSYTWGGIPEESTLAQFLLTANNNYIICKLLTIKEREQFSTEKTISSWKDTIIDWRRAGNITKEKAREVWDDLVEYGGFYENAESFYYNLPYSVDEFFDGIAYEYLVYEPSSLYNTLDKVILPTIREAIKLQLEVAQITAPVAEPADAGDLKSPSPGGSESSSLSRSTK